MKIVACSDAHTDARCCGVERFDEIADAFGEVREYAVLQDDPCMLVFGGDLCDGEDGRDVLRASTLAIGHANYAHLHGVEDQLWLVGNHDVLGDGSTTLDPLAEAIAGFGHVAKAPMRIDLPEDADAGSVLALPYSSKPYDAADALAEFLRETKDAAQRIVFTHLMLPGMHPGSESQEMARGKDRMFPVELLKTARRCTVVAGHYHAGGMGPGGIHIVGSMARNTFGEEENVPGFLVLDVQKDRVKIERVPFSSSRRMVTVRGGQALSSKLIAGAFVRLEPADDMVEAGVARLVEIVRGAGPLAVKVLGARRAAVVLEPSSAESLGIERRSTRDVVMAMTAEAVSRDRAALRGFVEVVLDESGL